MPLDGSIIRAIRPKIAVPQGLVGYWPLDLGSLNWGGNVAYDRSGNNNHGTLTGTITSAAIRTGRIGQGLYVTGSQYMEIASANSLDFSSGGYSISLWCNLDAIGSQAAWVGIISKGGTDNDWSIQRNGSSNDMIVYQNGSNSVTYTGAFSALAGQGTNHLAITYDGTNVEVFLNFVSQGQQALTAPLQNSNRPVRIGAERTGIGSTGWYDDVRLYKRCLRRQEIFNIYEAGRQGRA